MLFTIPKSGKYNLAVNLYAYAYQYSTCYEDFYVNGTLKTRYQATGIGISSDGYGTSRFVIIDNFVDGDVLGFEHHYNYNGSGNYDILMVNYDDGSYTEIVMN